MFKANLWLVTTLLVISSLMFGACAPTQTQMPQLSDALKRGCQRTRPPDDFGIVGLAVGETAVNFKLKDIHGNEFSLEGLLSEKPVVIEFGSFT